LGVALFEETSIGLKTTKYGATKSFPNHSQEFHRRSPAFEKSPRLKKIPKASQPGSVLVTSPRTIPSGSPRLTLPARDQATSQVLPIKLQCHSSISWDLHLDSPEVSRNLFSRNSAKYHMEVS